jgi:hypothetical protein
VCNVRDGASVTTALSDGFVMAYFSDGKGSFNKNKHYAADNVHVVAMNRATTTTPKDPATGTFNGCPAPTSCWIPQLSNGQEWFPLDTKN